MKKEYVYSEHTYNSKNPLARFAHRARFAKGIKIVLEKEFKDILDYGAGDNMFLEELKLKNESIQLNAYEPILKIVSNDEIKVFSKLEDLKDKKFDVVTCFETLEHFNENAQSQMVQEFHKKLNDKGRVIISVPIEIGFPSIIKNIRRLGYGKRNHVDIKNSIQCLLGRDVPEVRQLEGFIPSHIGFNHNKLEKIFLKFFKISRKETSPFKNLSDQFNSQVFYILEKK